MKLQVLIQVSVLFPSIWAQLHDAAKLAGLDYFGTATENPSDPAYQLALKNTSDFGQITPANSMKWDSIEPQPNKFTFAGGDAIAKLAKANNQLLRCHNLVWHNQLPTWVSGGTWTKETLTAALKNHITTQVTHYKGQCYAWDVVNEALEDNGTFRNDVFFRVLGQDYITIAFETAAAADPAAKLYYNDFNIETPGKKSTAAQGIIKTLKAAGAKVDGCGFQAHFTVGGTPSKAVQMANLQAFTGLGVEVAITELDIRMKLPSTDAQVAQQKKDYATTTSACVEVKGCVGVTVWDFDDKYSWIPSTFPGTGDGCIFDNTVKPKQSYFGALAGLGPAASNSTKSGVSAQDASMSKSSDAGKNSTSTLQHIAPLSTSAPGGTIPSVGSTNSTITPPILKVGNPAARLEVAVVPMIVLSLVLVVIL